MRNISLRPRAETDLDGILVYYAYELKAPQTAARVEQQIVESIERAADMPTLGHSFEGEGLSRSYRRILSGSYWVYYTFTAQELTVWRIFHASRDTDNLGYHIFED